MKKALLILFGGRSMPNMLTIIHERPKLIVAIVSKDFQDKLFPLEFSIKALFQSLDHEYELDTTYVVDAFDLGDVTKKCIQAFADYPNFNWIFNITAATTIMSIGAYEAAKEFHSRGRTIRCWYLDTAHSKVVSLLGRGRNSKIFNLKVEEYIIACYCTFNKGKLIDEERTCCQIDWLPFAQRLGQNQSEAKLLKQIIEETGGAPKKDEVKTYHLKKISSDDAYAILEFAEQTNILSNLQKNKFSSFSFRLTELQYHFLNGTWLEVYVWEEALKAQIFQDIEWGREFVDSHKKMNELDTAMIYKAQLVIAECKTSGDPFKAEHLYKLEAIIQALGSNFVSTLFVTSQPTPHDIDSQKQLAYERFLIRAESAGILVVPGEQIADVGEKLIKQATQPIRKRL